MLLREAGLALVARKRFFSGVNPVHTAHKHALILPVSHHRHPLRIISVPAMHLECRILGKPGLTVGALERPHARVRPLMQRQGRFGAERLSAVGADVLLVAAFVDLMCGRDRRSV